MKGTKNKTLLGRLKGRPEIPVLCATLGLRLLVLLAALDKVAVVY